MFDVSLRAYSSHRIATAVVVCMFAELLTHHDHSSDSLMTDSVFFSELVCLIRSNQVADSVCLCVLLLERGRK